MTYLMMTVAEKTKAVSNIQEVTVIIIENVRLGSDNTGSCSGNMPYQKRNTRSVMMLNTVVDS